MAAGPTGSPRAARLADITELPVPCSHELCPYLALQRFARTLPRTPRFPTPSPRRPRCPERWYSGCRARMTATSPPPAVWSSRFPTSSRVSCGSATQSWCVLDMPSRPATSGQEASDREGAAMPRPAVHGELPPTPMATGSSTEAFGARVDLNDADVDVWLVQQRSGAVEQPRVREGHVGDDVEWTGR